MKESPQIEQLLARLPAGLWLVNLDLRVTFYTGGAVEPLGLDTQDLLGLHIDDVLGATDQNDPGVQEHLAALQGVSSSYSVEWHGRHFQCTVTPLRDSSGEIVGVAGLALDISEGMQAEEELRRRERQLRAAEQLTRTGSAERDLVTGELRWTDGLYRIFRLDPDVVQPSLETILEHTVPEDRHIVEGVLAQIGSGLDHFSYDMRIRRADGERRVLHVEGTVEQGLALSTVRDVTEEHERERELLEAQQRFELVSRATSDIIWDWDLESGEVWRGRGSDRLTGCVAESRPSAELLMSNIHPDDRERVERSVRDALQSSDRLWTSRYCLRCADGTILHVVDRAFIIRDASGNATRMVGAMTDVSREREAEEALAAAEEQFRSIVEQSFVGVYIVTEDEILYANPKAWEIFGYDPSTSVLPSPLDLIHPLDREEARKALQNQLSGHSRSREYRVRCIRSDGSKIVVDFYWTATRFRGREVLLGMLVDTTERVRAEKEVRNRERWFRTLIEHASDAISVISLEGTILYKSPSVEHILGYLPSEMIGKDVFELVHPGDRADVENRFEEVLRQENTSQPFELRYRHKNGSWRLIETVLSPARDPDGNEIVISNYRDVTEARHLRRQYEESERIAALGRVASSMAHEFNNVLMGIQPFVEVIKRSSDPEQLSKAASQIAASIRRGKNVTDQVLRFTRGQQKVLGPVRVLSWMGAQLPEIRAITPETIHLDLSLPDEDLWITGNLEQLQQVLINLVSNAIQAMPEGGELLIAAERARQSTWSFGHVPDPESMLHLAVSDTGVGIDPELHQKIFEPLFSTGKIHGTGLGLSVTRQIITAHEGYLFVESQPDRGATFHVFIPVSTARPDDREPRGDSRLDERIRRVLLIEDEDMIAEGLRILFEMVDVELERASTGMEGVEMARSYRPDAIILDIGLPDIEGEEVFERIRSTDSEIPIVFATGHADQQRLGNLLRKPHTAFLGKPFELDSLISVLNAALRDEDHSD